MLNRVPLLATVPAAAASAPIRLLGLGVAHEHLRQASAIAAHGRAVPCRADCCALHLRRVSDGGSLIAADSMRRVGVGRAMAYAEAQAQRAHALDAEIALAHHDLRKPVLAPAADHLCAGTGLTPPTSAPGLGSPAADCVPRTARSLAALWEQRWERRARLACYEGVRVCERW